MPGVKYWNEVARKALVGRKIVKASYEDTFGDGNLGIIFELDDGTLVTVSRDDEGNGPGALFIDNAPKGRNGGLPVIGGNY